jgi:hypothetical protein
MRRGALAAAAALALGAAPRPSAAMQSQHLFELATATGPVRSTWASLAYDRGHDELLVLHDGLVRVFNRNGMEVYSFGADGDLGSIRDVAVLDDGGMLVLSILDGQLAVSRCDFRGDRVGELKVAGVPKELEPFRPDRIAWQGGRLYLVDSGGMRVAVADASGAVKSSFALFDLLGIDPRKRGEAHLGGFSADAAGNMYLTIPTLFTAAVVSPEGKVRAFGTHGSTPGKFNIIGKMVSDEWGNLYLTDRLRSVVMVFDKELQFQGEFGYRGEGKGNLVAPWDIAAGNGKVFVAQAGNRGVSVFRVVP